MAIQFGGGNSIPELGMIVYTTVYEFAGDFRTETLKKIGLSSSTYARRVVVIRGGFNISYPESDVPTLYDTPEARAAIGGIIVWPLAENVEVKKFTIWATEDNSAHHCINPINKSQQIQHTVTQITKNTNFIVKQGSVYCTNVDYKINGTLQKAGVLIVCKTQDATITPQSDGAIVKFTAVDVTDSNLLNAVD